MTYPPRAPRFQLEKVALLLQKTGRTKPAAGASPALATRTCGFLLPGLPCVALYCVPGGVRVVSGVRVLRVAGSFVTHTCGLSLWFLVCAPKLLSAAGARSQVALDLGSLLWLQPAHDEGCQVRLDLRTPHYIASREVSPSVSSARNFLKALAVLLFTVPRGMPVRPEISLWESPPNMPALSLLDAARRALPEL